MQSRFLQATNNYYMWISTHAPITSILENVHSPFFLLALRKEACIPTYTYVLVVILYVYHECLYVSCCIFSVAWESSNKSNFNDERTHPNFKQILRSKQIQNTSHTHTCIYNIKSNNHIEHLTTDRRVGDESQCMDSASS